MTPVPSALSDLSGLATDPMQVLSANNAIPASMGGGVVGGAISGAMIAGPVGAIVGGIGSIIGGIGRVEGAKAQAQAQINQINNNIAALMQEKSYNVQNYQQFIADQLASNKMSFYASGLDYGSGTAKDVIMANKAASTADMNMMIRNYDTQIKNLKTQRAEAEKAKQSAWTNFF